MKTAILEWYQNHKRRVWAGMFLGAAIVMTVSGLTWAEPRLRGMSALVWWGAVFLFLLTALALAALDLIYLRQDLAEEKRMLAKKYLLEKEFLERLKEKIEEKQEMANDEAAVKETAKPNRAQGKRS